ncbi:MAG: MerR family transcriptional regulator [Acidobacteria bacterium]|nr:MerR family transcriptional regulator [Acidobacteriota bacterium]MCA1612512.1 MerR family transcriptional regulator [Acidobacteriota bacterium]
MKSEPEFYKPAEACRIAEVAPYVLRYWETEFPSLSEGKEKGAARLYTGRDVRIISRIRELLYDEGFTVAGAKKRLEAEISEGRFDDGLQPAPPRSEQKKPANPPAPPVIESPETAFLSESSSRGGKTAVASARRAAPAPEFPDRKRVLRELKEIARLLDRPRRAH